MPSPSAPPQRTPPAPMVSPCDRDPVLADVQAPPAQLVSTRLSNGMFQFTFPGQAGRTNRVEASTNFVNWTVLTNVFGTNRPVTFRDTNALSKPRQFFRVRRL